MYRMQKPDQFCARCATVGPRAAGRQLGEVIPEHYPHRESIHALMAEINGPGTGAPSRHQGSWDLIVEDDSSGTWVRLGIVRKHPDHRVEYIPDPSPAAA